MRHRLNAFLAAVCLAAATAASGHPATELYIPIGKSPGVSGVKSRIGIIESLATAQTGLTIATQDGPARVAIGKSTKVYVQYADPTRTNEVGTYSDCKLGLRAEALVADDGTVTWVKVLVP